MDPGCLADTHAGKCIHTSLHVHVHVHLRLHTQVGSGLALFGFLIYYFVPMALITVLIRGLLR